jgi:hypothetical protein
LLIQVKGQDALWPLEIALEAVSLAIFFLLLMDNYTLVAVGTLLFPPWKPSHPGKASHEDY